MTYPALADLKSYLGVTTSASDTVLQSYLTVSIKFVERFTGRVFVAESRTLSIPSASSAVRLRGRLLALPMDVLSVSRLSVVGESNETVVPSTDFQLVSALGAAPYRIIKLHPSAQVRFNFDGYHTISVGCMAGYSTSSPPDVNLAILQIAAGMYRKSLSRVTGTNINRPIAAIYESPGIPVDAAALLVPYRRFM